MFQGYCPETVDFLWGIRMNNNRDWFQAHKQDYVNYLYEPTKAMGKAIFAPFANKPGNLLKVSRIYKDARMHPAVPYKESLWTSIQPDVEWWGENPCLYFEIRPEGVSYGFILLHPRPATMEAIRMDIAAHPRRFLKLIRDTEAAAGQPVTAKCYKKPKQAPSPALAPYFAWKDYIACSVHEDFSPEVFDESLRHRVCSFINSLIPLYDYFSTFKV